MGNKRSIAVSRFIKLEKTFRNRDTKAHRVFSAAHASSILWVESASAFHRMAIGKRVLPYCETFGGRRYRFGRCAFGLLETSP